MDDGKKLINWVAGVATLIVALLIVIVVLEPREGGVSRAAASRAVALTIAPKDEIEENGPEQSFFPEELQNEWYVKYMDFLYEQGYLDPDTCPATEGTALSEVTYGELAGFAAAVRETAEQGTEVLQVYENTSHSDRQVSREDFWEFYDVFRSAADQEGNVKELTTDLYGTPDNVDGAAPWTAYTNDGRYLFEGLSLDSYIDKTIRFLVRDQDILKVDAVVSDEIVYENAWISGFSGNSVTIFIGNIQREFPVRGVLRNE